MKTFLTTAFTLGILGLGAFAKDVDIAVSELPPNIAEAVTKAHPGATTLSAEKDLKANGDVQHYEVKVRHNNEQLEVTVLPDGTIQKTEKDS